MITNDFKVDLPKRRNSMLPTSMGIPEDWILNVSRMLTGWFVFCYRSCLRGVGLRCGQACNPADHSQWECDLLAVSHAHWCYVLLYSQQALSEHLGRIVHVLVYVNWMDQCALADQTIWMNPKVYVKLGLYITEYVAWVHFHIERQNNPHLSTFYKWIKPLCGHTYARSEGDSMFFSHH